MSGRKQHFIPQSLLRGFGRKAKGDKTQIAAYTHDRGAFIAATDGVGAERNFYSELALEPSDETLDDKITKYEASVADVLFELRSLQATEAADAQNAAELVTHLVVRNDHFRKTATYAATSLFGGFGNLLAEQDSAMQLMGVAGNQPSAFFTENMEQVWEENELMWRALGFSKAAFQEFAFVAFRAGFPRLHGGIAEPIKNAFSRIVEKASEAAAEAQRRSLEQALAPPIRAEKLSEFHWQVVHWPEPLILPDCVAIGLEQNGEMSPLIFADVEDLAAVSMPLASDRLLWGSRHKEMSPNWTNEAAASWAWDFFVCAEKSERFEVLQKLLRMQLSPFLEKATQEILEKATSQFSAY